MTDPFGMQQISQLDGDISVQIAERLILIGEQIRPHAIESIQQNDLITLAEKLVLIYDSLSFPTAFRKRAAGVVANLATHDTMVLETVIKNAEAYARMQHIDDAFPYSPNSFEVLATVSPILECAVSFLSRIAHKDWGVARWSAVQALLTVDNVVVRGRIEAGCEPDVRLGLPSLMLSPRKS